MAVACLPAFNTNTPGTPTFGSSNFGRSNFGQSSFGPSGFSSPSFQHVVKPVICAQPPYRGPVLHSILANKPRSPPDSAGSGTTLESPDEGDKCSTPYRLPRISPRATPCTDDTHVSPDSEEKVWGRFGYEDNVRMPELGPNVHKALMNHPSTPGVCVPTVVPQGVGSRSVAAAQMYRQSVMVVPKFRNAAITPSVYANVIRDVDDASVHVYKSLLEKAAHREESLQNPAPTPTHNSRSVSPAKSTRSIHWALGSTKHALFDVKGRSRKQGPYSREFTVRCMAPATWMRMKWGRQRPIVH